MPLPCEAWPGILHGSRCGSDDGQPWGNGSVQFRWSSFSWPWQTSCLKLCGRWTLLTTHCHALSLTYMNGSWQLGSRTVSTKTSGCGTMSVRNDGKSCGSCCGAFQSLMFPLSGSSQKINNFELVIELFRVISRFQLTILTNYWFLEREEEKRKQLVMKYRRRSQNNNQFDIFCEIITSKSKPQGDFLIQV